MPQLAPRSLDWYRATYVHERLAVHRAAAAVGTPPPWMPLRARGAWRGGELRHP
jgi:hypothetical protein